MLELERRELMATMVAATVLATFPASTAHAQTPLNIDQLRILVKSQRERSRLFMYMDLTIYTLTPYIFNKHEELETYTDLSKLTGQTLREGLDGIYQWFNKFYNGEFENTLLAALDGDNAEQLIADAISNSESLVGKVREVFAESGITPEGNLGSESLRGIKTVEQLHALESGEVQAKPFLCRYFPFSYFCD